MRSYFALFIILISVSVFAEEQVKVWDIYEGKMYNKTHYENPYKDVDLNVRWKNKHGDVINSMGFYDGDSTWRFRFMPNEWDKWTYTATFSDGSGTKKGSFKAVRPDHHGPVVVDDANPNWFGYADGSHGIIRSLHVGDCFFAENWDNPIDENDGNYRQVFLDWAQEQGYNHLSVASFLLNRAADNT